ncbi:MAG: hypothetical protein KAH01_03625 [Caldisericia bacterium]|nr:hypothetical protein [Caldisericia bacterium]
MGNYWEGDFDFFEETNRVYEKGIKSNTRRGVFAESWFGKEWISDMETYAHTSRQGRGRSYARNNYILELQVKPGLLEARVKGSYDSIYNVKIKFDQWTDEEWEAFFSVIPNDPKLVYQMICGSFPESIEQLLMNKGLSIVPGLHPWENDEAVSCNCPDGETFCKHVISVFYLLGEYLDYSFYPLLILRGKYRDEIVKRIVQKTLNTLSEKVTSEENQTYVGSSNSLIEQGIEDKLTRTFSEKPFWEGKKPFPPFNFPPQFMQNGPYFISLGDFLLWQGENDLHDALRAISKKLSKQAELELKTINLESFMEEIPQFK